MTHKAEYHEYISHLSQPPRTDSYHNDLVSVLLSTPTAITYCGSDELAP